MQLLSLMVGPDHPVPITPQGGSVTLTVDNTGGTVYYSDSPQVSAASHQGAIAPGATITLTKPAWLIGSAAAGVSVRTTSVWDEWAANAPAGAPGVATANRLAVFGHSGAEPYGVLHPYSWPHILAQKLGAHEMNYAIAGSSVCYDDSLTEGTPNNMGGYATVLNAAIPRLPYQAANGYPAYRAQAPYVPMSDLYAIFQGGNDLHWVSTSVATSVPIIVSALEACVARCRAGGLWSANDTGLAYNGFTKLAVGSFAGASTLGAAAYATAANSTITFTVPADYDGGEITFTFLVGGTAGGVLSFAGPGISFPDGSSTLTMTGKAPIGTGRSTGICKRMRMPVTGAAQTVTCTLTSLTGNNNGTAWAQCTFDSVTIEATQVPRVVVMTQPHTPPGFNSLVAGAPTPTYSNSDLDTLAAGMSTLCAKWPDGYVFLGDTKAAWAALGIDSISYGSPGAAVISDNGHHNEYGQGVDAIAVYDAIVAGPPVGASLISNAQPLYRMVGYGTHEPAFGANWANFSKPDGLEFTKDAAGLVHVRGYVKNASSPPSNSVICQLPTAYRPAENTAPFMCVTGAGAGYGSCLIDTSGNLTYVGGDTGTWFSLNCCYQADGGSSLGDLHV